MSKPNLSKAETWGPLYVENKEKGGEMKLKVENDRLIVVEKKKELHQQNREQYIATVYSVTTIETVEELARLLKPYLDSIPNCESGCKK